MKFGSHARQHEFKKRYASIFNNKDVIFYLIKRYIVDYERLLSSSQAMVYIANSAYILRKL